MYQSLDVKETEILSLVHCDFAGPIQPLGKGNYRYVLNFIDDFSGLIMLYFLGHESDTLLATKQYLADVSPYDKVKRIRSAVEACWAHNLLSF